MTLNKKNKLILLFVLAAIFGSIISFVFHSKINPNALFIDSLAYKATALNIIEYGRFSNPDIPVPNAFRAPGYPLWLAIIYLIFGSFQYVVPIGILIFSFTAPLTYLIAEEVFNKKIAWISGLLVVFEPWAAFLSGTIMSEHLFMPVFLLGILCFIRYLKYEHRNYLYCSAAVMGVSAIIRPNALYLWLIIAAFVFFKEKGVYKYLKYPLLATFVFLLVIAPWLIRNKIVLGSWQITVLQGPSLYFEKFNAFQVYLGKIKNMEEGQAKGNELIKGFHEMTRPASDILMKAAIKGIREDLYEYIKLTTVSLPNFFIASSYSSLGYYLGFKEFKIQSEVLGLIKTQSFSQIWEKILEISWGERVLLTSGFIWPIISVLFLIGVFAALLKTKSFNVGIFFILGVIFYFDLITTLMNELARFRIQVQPFIFMFASAGLTSMLYCFRILKSKKLLKKLV